DGPPAVISGLWDLLPREAVDGIDLRASLHAVASAPSEAGLALSDAELRQLRLHHILICNWLARTDAPPGSEGLIRALIDRAVHELRLWQNPWMYPVTFNPSTSLVVDSQPVHLQPPTSWRWHLPGGFPQFSAALAAAADLELRE
ncbi:unnamed protein product, partial [Polarella glacialis]